VGKRKKGRRKLRWKDVLQDLKVVGVTAWWEKAKIERNGGLSSRRPRLIQGCSAR
jgi:hypothetical protein